MKEGLFDRYFRLLAGRLPAVEYGVIAEPTDEIDSPVFAVETSNSECLC